MPTNTPEGSYGLFADDNGTPALTASTAFTLTPGIYLYQGTTATPTADVGDTIGIVGYGFGATSAVTAKFNGTPVTLTPAATTGATGAFAVSTFTVPTVTPGDYPVTASDGTHTGTTTLEVYAATLTAPASEASGSRLPIGGSGWPGLDSLQIRYFQGSSNTYECTVYTDVNGTIPSQTCAVPTNLSAGAYVLTATDGSIVATLPVTVTPSATFLGPDGTSTWYVATGQTITVVGTGFTGGSSITATFNAKPITLSPAPTTSATGAFAAATFVVPEETSAGFYTVKISDASLVSVSIKLMVFVATLVSPTTAPAGTVYSVSGTGYPSNDSLQLRLYQGTSNTYICTVYTDVAGTLTSQNCTLPNTLPAGLYTLTLSDGYMSVSHKFTMAPDVVMIGSSGNTATASAGIGQPVSLDGYGFTPGASVSATLNAVKVKLTQAVTVGTNGQFTGTAFTVPSLTPGRYLLVVKDAAGKTATVTLRVFAAVITGPGSDKAGGLLPLSGSGWPHSDSIQVRLLQGADNSYVCTIYSDASGVIEPQDCTTPTGLPAGSYTLWATDGSVGVDLAGGFAITPAISLLNASSQPATTAAPGATLTLSGIGFAAGSTAATVKVGTTVVTTTPSSPPTNTVGAFSGVTFVVPSVAPGTYTVTVTDSHVPADSGTAQLTVS